MADKKLKEIWSARQVDEDIIIQFDWGNNRHHAVTIYPPCGKLEVVKALRIAADLILMDPSLD